MLFAFSANSQNPSHYRFDMEDGLPDLTVFEMLFDDEQDLWLGTKNGLCKYDGVKFTRYLCEDFSDNTIHSIYCEHGKIYTINMSYEVGVVEDNELKRLRFPVEAPERYFNITSTDDGKLYMIGNPYTIEFSEKNGERNHQFLPGGTRTIFEGKKGEILIIKREKPTNKFYFTNIFTNDSILAFQTKPYSSSFKIHQEPREVFIISASEIFIYNKEFKKIKKYSPEIIEKIPKNSLIHFYRDSRGRDWISTYDGLFRIENGVITGHYFKGQSVTKVLEDFEGNFWASTLNRGLIFIPNPNIFIFDKNSFDLPGENIKALKYDGKKYVYFGFANGDLSKINPRGVLEENYKGDENIVLDIHCDGNQVQAVSTKSIFYLDSKNAFPETKFTCPKDLEEDGAGNFWAGTCGAVFKNGQTVKESRCHEIHYGRYSDRMWFGMKDSLFYYKNNKFVYASGQPCNWIVDIQEVPDKSLWVGTEFKGVFHIVNNNIVKIVKPKNNFLFGTNAMLIDKNQTLWVGTNQGLAIGRPPDYDLQFLNTNAGLSSNQVNALEEVEENIWVGTAKGVVVLPNDFSLQDTLVTSCKIDKIEVGGSLVDLANDQPIALSHDRNKIDIFYSANAFRHRNSLRFAYRLSGLDGDWTITSSQFLSLNLSPGSYEFELKVHIDNKNINNPVVIQKIIVHPPVWQRWWFILLAMGFLGFILYRIYRYRINQVKKAEEEKTEINRRLEGLRMKALYAQMNPHFVFNCMNALQSLVQSGDNKKTLHYISTFSKLVRTIFENTKKDLIELEEEVEFLKLYTKLENMRLNDSVDISFDLGNALEEDVFLPPMIIQPILENAFRHGLMHKEKNRKLQVRFNIENNKLKCEVEDNGIGRDKSNAQKKWRPKKHESSGLKITEERLILLNSSSENNPQIKVTDLKTAEGLASGTLVEMWFDLPEY